MIRKLTLFFFIPAVLVAAVLIANRQPRFAQWFGGVANLGALFAAIFAYLYVVYTAEMVRSIAQGQREERRPYVLAVLEFEDHSAWLSIQNIRKIAALNVRLAITPNFPVWDEKLSVENVLSKPISFLPPNGLIRIAVHPSSGVLFDSGAPREYVVHLSYNDAPEGKPFEHEYKISLDSYEHAIQVGALDIASVARSLSKTETHLQAVSILASHEYHSRFPAYRPKPPSKHRKLTDRILERRYRQRKA